MIEKFKDILKKENLSSQDFSKEIGINHRSFRTLTTKGSKIPRWIKSFIFGYKLGKNNKNGKA